MNAKNLLPLTAAVVFALCAGAMVVSATQADTGRTAAAAAAERIVDLPTAIILSRNRISNSWARDRLTAAVRAVLAAEPTPTRRKQP